MTSTCVYGSPTCECGVVEAPKTNKIKRGLVLLGLVLSSWLVTVLALIGGLTVYDRVANPSEDSGNILLNCHIYGDGNCGSDAPWHGFINLF